MKKFLFAFGLGALLCASAFPTVAADAKPPKPSIEDRLADLEAYVTNGSRQTNAPTALATSPGPGHNAWQMASSALVLFMTLPGLALFHSPSEQRNGFWPERENKGRRRRLCLHEQSRIAP